MSDKLRMSGDSGMAPSSRDRLSVDLHGLKAALLERAQALGVTPSGFVRTVLAEALGEPVRVDQCRRASTQAHGGRVRLCLRMRREQAQAVMDAARRAAMSPGDYVGGIVLGVPALSSGCSRADQIATLTASTAELSTLGRNLHRLTALLRQANVEPARQYREMLDTLGADVRQHLMLAASLLAELRPARPPQAGLGRRFHAAG